MMAVGGWNALCIFAFLHFCIFRHTRAIYNK